jgi:cystathionine beta-lyase
MAERNLDFDTVIDRRNTSCLKFDFAKKRGMPEDVLPLWVADMDFKTSSYIQDALTAQAEHGIYGYTESTDSYFEAVHDWILQHYDWEVSEKWLVKTPGIVYALAMAVQAFTEKGDAVLIQQPVYYPFSGVIRDNGRRIVSNSLVYDGNGGYTMDFEDFEKKIMDEKVKLFFLCNPHNPVGRVWNRDELEKVGDICEKHGVVVVSDEIHADFVWKKKHLVLANLKENYKDFVITATAPSKTFNIAGLQVSNLFIPNPELKKKLIGAIDASGYSQLNAAGLIAAEAAYRHGEEWYQAMKAYVKSNIAYTAQYLRENIPQLKMIEPEGTYLVWIDCRGLGLSNQQLEDLIVQKAGLWLDSGIIFGDDGRGFQRINIACPRATLTLALEKLKKAVDELSA